MTLQAKPQIPQDQLLELINDLEDFNSPEVRKAAAEKLSRLGSHSNLALVRLQTVANETYNHDLKIVFNNAIEAMRLTDTFNRTKAQRPKSKTVTMTAVSITERKMSLEDTARSFRKCNFCGKEALSTKATRPFTDALSGPERFYCTFCLRHKFNGRSSKDILILSFRGIIGYYYYAFYALSKTSLMFISEIRDYVELHAKAGLQNPIFTYDPDSFLWFVDFTRVGKSKKKVPIEQVLGTIGEILLTFNLHETVKDIKPHVLYKRYEEAVLKFYHQRHRPEGNRVLSPTLIKTGASEYAAEKLASSTSNSYGTTYNDTKRKINFDETKQFTPLLLGEWTGKKY